MEVVLNAVEVLIIGPESWDKELGEFFDDASQVGIIRPDGMDAGDGWGACQLCGDHSVG